MSWARVLQNDANFGGSLRERLIALFDEQQRSWPQLAEGVAALARVQTKALVIDGSRIIVQLNPGRSPSTLANVDPAAIAARPCFLCPYNMPAEERGIVFEDLVLMPNPYPVLPLHFTAASREHRPQRIAGSVDALLQLARAIGPEMVVFYNGPRCAASAPDHFHFQCAHAQGIPVLDEMSLDGEGVHVQESIGRTICIVSGNDAALVRHDFEQSLAALAASQSSDEEPMINLLARYEAGRYTVLVFPRSAHRPACFYAGGEERIAVSPGVFEMCGILVVTHQSDFDRLNEDTVRAVFKEVCTAPTNSLRPSVTRPMDDRRR